VAGGFTESFGHVTHQCAPLPLLFKPAGVAHESHYSVKGARSLIVEVGAAALVPLALAMYRSFREDGETSAACELALEVVDGGTARLRLPAAASAAVAAASRRRDSRERPGATLPDRTGGWRGGRAV
jgi:hypothetical protein